MLLVVNVLSYDSAYGKIESVAHDIKWYGPIRRRNYGCRDKFHLEFSPCGKKSIIKDEGHILN